MKKATQVVTLKGKRRKISSSSEECGHRQQREPFKEKNHMVETTFVVDNSTTRLMALKSL